ncbi:MAG: hypothetical protein RIT27_619 [Pseudomonadota bacterium]
MKNYVAMGLIALALQPVWAAENSVDKREVLPLSDVERNLVLSEMRQFVGALQSINQALANGDRDTAAQKATEVGMAAAGTVPKELMQKLPVQFRQFGMATHRSFDEFAANIKEFDDPRASFGQMANLMSNCLACHALFQIR